MRSVTIHRHKRPSWVFEEDEFGNLEYTTQRGSLYRLFDGDSGVWIGRWCEAGPDSCWVSWEAEIRATHFDMVKGRYYFRQAVERQRMEGWK